MPRLDRQTITYAAIMVARAARLEQRAWRFLARLHGVRL